MPATATAVLTDTERQRARAFCSADPRTPRRAFCSATDTRATRPGLTDVESARASVFCGSVAGRPRMLSTEALSEFVKRLNAQWDEVDTFAHCLPAARRVDLYRPHNGVPRAITLDHWWAWERTADGYRVCNIRTGQAAHVRAAA